MKSFSKSKQLKFWTMNNEPFKGDMCSDVILALSKKNIGENVIDIGAGSGALLKKFKKIYKHKNNFIAIDLVPKSTEVLQGDCTKLNFDREYFDTLFCTDVIEHLNNKDLDMCLTESNRVLKISGRGIFTTINNECLDASSVYCPECGCKFHRWGHCQVFTKSRINSLFEKKGFDILEIKTLNLGILAKFGFLARIFYFFKIYKIFNLDFLESDLFLVVKKVKNI